MEKTDKKPEEKLPMDDMWVFKKLDVRCKKKGPHGQLCGIDQEDNYCCWICSRLDECAKRWRHQMDGKVKEGNESFHFCPRGKSHWCSAALQHWEDMKG